MRPAPDDGILSARQPIEQLLLSGQGKAELSYFNGYRFEVRSAHAFKVEAGRETDLEIVAYEKGTDTTPLEERPGVKYILGPNPPGH